MQTSSYSYQSILSASQRANWRVEDIIGGERRLDFARPFMPESLARVEPLAFLTARRAPGAEPDPGQRLPVHVRGV